MSLFGSLMGDVEEDPFFGSHMRHMRQMNNMMNSMFSDPFSMLGGGMGMGMMGPLAIGGPQQGGMGGAMMPFMPQMPSFNRLFSGMPGLENMNGGMGSSFSSSTVMMSSGPNGAPQVFSSSSSTKIGPNGVKETRKTLQDSRTGTKKMSIGHFIDERAHIIEREQNVYSGDAEEKQEYINIEEEEAEDFNREFQTKAGALAANNARSILPRRASPPLLALPAPPASSTVTSATASNAATANNGSVSPTAAVGGSRRHPRVPHPAPRRPLRTSASPLATSSASVREIYAGSHPLRHKNKSHKRHSDH